MNLFSIETINSLQQGIGYLLDPDNRIILIGLALMLVFLIGKFIFRSIKKLVIIAAILVVIYFGFQLFTNVA